MQQQKICCFSKIFQWCHRTGDEKSQIQILPLHLVLTEYGIWLGLRPMLSKWLELTKLRVAGQNSNVPGISRGICLLWVSPWADKTMTGKRQLPPDREKQKSKWRAATYQKARKRWGHIHALSTLLWAHGPYSGCKGVHLNLEHFSEDTWLFVLFCFPCFLTGDLSFLWDHAAPLLSCSLVVSCCLSRWDNFFCLSSCKLTSSHLLGASVWGSYSRLYLLTCTIEDAIPRDQPSQTFRGPDSPLPSDLQCYLLLPNTR